MIVGTYWRSLRDPVGRRFVRSVQALREGFERPIITANKQFLAGWAPAAFKDDRRALANVERVDAVGLDVDDSPAFGDVVGGLTTSRALIHTTFSHTPAAPRLRVILFASRGMTAEEYRAVWTFAAARMKAASVEVDRAAKDPSRLWFVPGVAPGGEYRSALTEGAPLDVDAILRAAPLPSSPVHAPAPVPRVSLIDRIERARKYLEQCDPAVSGQGGHTRTFIVAERLVRGFELSTEIAYELLAFHWNPKCRPPWSERELRRKLEQAATTGRMPHGELSNAEPRRRAG